MVERLLDDRMTLRWLGESLLVGRLLVEELLDGRETLRWSRDS